MKAGPVSVDEVWARLGYVGTRLDIDGSRPFTARGPHANVRNRLVRGNPTSYVDEACEDTHGDPGPGPVNGDMNIHVLIVQIVLPWMLGSRQEDC